MTEPLSEEERAECSCDPESFIVWRDKRGPYCGESYYDGELTQPMAACRFGKAKYEKWMGDRAAADALEEP